MTHYKERKSFMSHGRFEIRECWTISDAELLKQIRNLSDWKGLQTIVMVRRERRIGSKVEIEVNTTSPA